MCRYTFSTINGIGPVFPDLSYPPIFIQARIKPFAVTLSAALEPSLVTLSSSQLPIINRGSRQVVNAAPHRFYEVIKWSYRAYTLGIYIPNNPIGLSNTNRHCSG